MQPIPTEQIQSTVQVLLAFLDSDGANVPGNMLEGVVSGKSLLRGILTGNLVVCQVPPANGPDGAPGPQPQEPVKKKATRKKAAKKTAKKAA